MSATPAVKPPVQLDTQAFVKQMQLAHGVYGTLDEQRSALRADIHEVNYITLKDFTSDVLPQSYIAKFPDVDLVIAQLEKNSAFQADGSWSDLTPRAPRSGEHEVEYYARLVKIVAAISEAATKVATHPVAVERAPQHLDYINNGNKALESGHRVNTSRPDGFFVLKDRVQDAATPGGIFWWDIAVVAEFKKECEPKAIVDNVDKMLWGLHHMMREDPRRDFAYGFTVEDATVKMWYCDRSNIVISDEFDIHKDRRQFVIFCLSLLYASMEELGWDASTTRLPPVKQDKKDAKKTPKAGTATPTPKKPHPQYEIKVRVDEQVTRRFVTISPISISGADGILGRGTRVWEARELLQDGTLSEKVVAIKDYWIDEDREREGNIVQSILNAAPDDARRAQLENHIVGILCHGDVYRTHRRVVKRDEQHPEVVDSLIPDSTRDLKGAIALRNLAIRLDCPKAKPAQTPSRSDRLATGVQTPVPPSAYHSAPVREGRPLPGVRRRNRLVMKQVGKALHSEQSLRAAFSALRDVCFGLELIHRYGWMHRDLSTGNIIIWEGRGILTDFEYAKQIPPKGSIPTTPHPGRTGTPYFMAVEVQCGQYLFRPQYSGLAIPDSEDDDDDEEQASPSPRVPPTLTFPSTAPNQATEPTDDPRKRRRARKSNTADGAEYEEYPGQASQAPGQASPTTLTQKQTLSEQKSGDTPSASPFAYNPAHDFEALIWIGNYFIFNRRVIEHPQQQPQEHLLAQCAYSRRLFSGLANEKSTALNQLRGTAPSTFKIHLEQLHPALREVGKHMETWMQTMKSFYIGLEMRESRAYASSGLIPRLRKSLAPFPAKIVDILAKEDIKVDDLPVDTGNVVKPRADTTSKVQANVGEVLADVTKKLEGSTRPNAKKHKS